MMFPWPASLQWLLLAWLGVSIAAEPPEGVRQIPVSTDGISKRFDLMLIRSM